MSLAELLLPLLSGGSGVVAFVGAGGKSSALFRLAGELEARGRSVLVTTTTRMAAPGAEPGGRVILSPEAELPAAGTWKPGPLPLPGVTLLFSREEDAEEEADVPRKVRGIHPSWVDLLRRGWDFVLVEADGSRRLPVKAPGPDEPVLPPGTDLVVGVVGLDCLGRPMDGRTVHRPGSFARVTGCAPGAPIGWEHLAALCRHPAGLFKGTRGEKRMRRVVLLNKADLAPFLPTGEQLSELAADLVVVSRLEGTPRFDAASPSSGRRTA